MGAGGRRDGGKRGQEGSRRGKGGRRAHRLGLTHLITRCRHHHLDRGPHRLVEADAGLRGEAHDCQAALGGHLHLCLVAVCDGHQALAIAIAWEQGGQGITPRQHTEGGGAVPLATLSGPTSVSSSSLR